MYSTGVPKVGSSNKVRRGRTTSRTIQDDGLQEEDPLEEQGPAQCGPQLTGTGVIKIPYSGS